MRSRIKTAKPQKHLLAAPKNGRRRIVVMTRTGRSVINANVGVKTEHLAVVGKKKNVHMLPPSGRRSVKRACLQCAVRRWRHALTAIVPRRHARVRVSSATRIPDRSCTRVKKPTVGRRVFGSGGTWIVYIRAEIASVSFLYFEIAIETTNVSVSRSRGFVAISSRTLFRTARTRRPRAFRRRIACL